MNGNSQGALLIGDAGSAFTPLGLRECVNGVAARNFSERGATLQSFAERFKPLRSALPFGRV